MKTRLGAAAVVVTAAVITGCGGSNDPGYLLQVHPTSGNVTRAGQPVKQAFVRFVPVDPKTVAVPAGKTGPEVLLATQTDDNGHYEMSSYYKGDGVPAGEYKVVVSELPKGSELLTEDVQSQAIAEAAQNGKHPKYSDVYDTPLRATVKAGPNTVDFAVD